jgi:hypothetical protein
MQPRLIWYEAMLSIGADELEVAALQQVQSKTVVPVNSLANVHFQRVPAA